MQATSPAPCALRGLPTIVDRQKDPLPLPPPHVSQMDLSLGHNLLSLRGASSFFTIVRVSCAQQLSRTITGNFCEDRISCTLFWNRYLFRNFRQRYQNSCHRRAGDLFISLNKCRGKTFTFPMKNTGERISLEEIHGNGKKFLAFRCQEFQNLYNNSLNLFKKWQNISCLRENS